MLGFFSAKSDHPLIDAKQAKQLFAELAAADPATALDDASALLESLVADQQISPEQRFEALQQLDHCMLAPTMRFARSYAAADLSARNEEIRLWRLGYGYWSSLAGYYADCIAALDGASPKSKEALTAQLPLICIRALHAFSKSLKWQQFRYGPVEDNFWITVGRVYLRACELDVTQKVRPRYPDGPNTTPEREYLKVLAFHASSMDSLLPQEIELADRVLDELLPRFQFTWQCQPDSVYWVNGLQNVPPTRLVVQPTAAAGLRFFNPGQALDAVHQIRETMRQGVPHTLNLGASYPVSMLVDVLGHLTMYWSPVPPQRSHPRLRVKSRMVVLSGLAESYLGVRGEATHSEESWVVEDVSQGGFRVVATLSGKRRMSINAILAMRPDGGDNWLLGIVRRLSRESDSIVSIGIETLSKKPAALPVDSGGIRTEVILLEDWTTLAEIQVVLPAKAWEDKIPMTFTHDGRHVRLVPDGQLQSGPDYLIGRYKVRIAESGE